MPRTPYNVQPINLEYLCKIKEVSKHSKTQQKGYHAESGKQCNLVVQVSHAQVISVEEMHRTDMVGTSHEADGNY